MDKARTMELTNKQKEALKPWLRTLDPEDIPDQITIENIGINGIVYYFSMNRDEYVRLYEKIGTDAWTREGLVKHYLESRDTDFCSHFLQQEFLGE